MGNGYFHRVAQTAKTRLWINNPTMSEVDKAIEAGAVSCTTNPTHTVKMLKTPSESEYVFKIIDHVIKEVKDDAEAAVLVQRGMVKLLMDQFLPLYEKNPGKEGFVSIQGDPNADEVADNIIQDALLNMKLGKNAIAKIPVTEAGLTAIEYLIGENVPIVATEIMGIAQAISACELYREVSGKTGKTPPLYITHISGIFDDYIKNAVKLAGTEISSDILWQAGIAVARKQYKLMKERNYPGIMLGGGARGLHHFTELVGGEMDITINWVGAADKLIELNPPVIYRMNTPVPQYVISELMEKLPDFKKAYMEDGLKVQEFKDYGPVVLFRSAFLKGWGNLMEAIKERRIASI